MADQNKKRKLTKSSDLLMQTDFLDRFSNSSKYINHEYQDYGIRLAKRLNDIEHKTLYIKLAKEVPRGYIEDAASFSMDYPNSYKKGKIFMWKLSEICKEKGYKITLYKKKKKKAKPEQLELI